MSLCFIETAVFTRRVSALGLEDDLRRLQLDLVKDPLAGDTDAGTGGLRKVRMADGVRRKGKRGGSRVHYLYLAKHDVVYLLFVYTKDESAALTATQKRELKKISEAIRAEWL